MVGSQPDAIKISIEGGTSNLGISYVEDWEWQRRRFPGVLGELLRAAGVRQEALGDISGIFPRVGVRRLELAPISWIVQYVLEDFQARPGPPETARGRIADPGRGSEGVLVLNGDGNGASGVVPELVVPHSHARRRDAHR